MSAATIERSPGIRVGNELTGVTVGGGQHGLGDLDTVVDRAAELLAQRFEMPVTIRFNSDRQSGGAWLQTHERDRIDANAEVGITAELITQSRLDTIKQMYERYDEPVPEIGQVGDIHIYAFLSARVSRFADLIEDDRRYACLPVNSVADALTLLSATADPSLVDFSQEA